MTAAASVRRGFVGGTILAAAAWTVTLSLAAAALDSAAFAAEAGGTAADSLRAPVAADSLVRDSTTTRRAGVQDTVTVLPPIKVASERSTAPERSTATAVRVERAKVMRFAPTVPSDALVTVPGVDLVKTGPWASRVSMRGLSGDRVLIMMDGVRLNTVRGHGAQSSMVPLDRLDEVDVLPGASSAAFGSDALGGVINFVTHRSLIEADPRYSVTLTARGAQPGESWGQSGRARFFSPHLGAEVSGYMGGLDHLHTPDGEVENSGYDDEDWSARGSAKQGPVLADYEHTHHAARDVGLPAFNGGPGSVFRVPPGASGVYPLQQRDADRLEFSGSDLGWLAEARVLGVLQNYAYRFTETMPESIFFRGRFTGLRETVAADRVTTHMRTASPVVKLAIPGDVRILGEYRHEESEGPRDSTVTIYDPSGAPQATRQVSVDAVPPSWRESWSIGTTAGQDFRDLWSLRLEGGLRYENVHTHADSSVKAKKPPDDTDDHHLSLEAGLSRTFGAFTPYVHAASGFRPPNLDELYFHDTIHGTLRLFGNDTLDAERSVSYEIGVRSGEAWGGKLSSARISAFRTNVEDMITFVFVGTVELVPNFQYVNLDRVRVEGIEGTADFRLAGTSLTVSASLPRSRNLDTGKPPDDAPVPSAAVELVAPVHRVLPQGSVALRWRWSDAVTDVDPSLARAAFSVTAVEASTIVGGVRGVFAVRNLWNHFYYEPLSFIPEPGRTYALSLRYEFGGALPKRQAAGGRP